MLGADPDVVAASRPLSYSKPATMLEAYTHVIEERQRVIADVFAKAMDRSGPGRMFNMPETLASLLLQIYAVPRSGLNLRGRFGRKGARGTQL